MGSSYTGDIAIDDFSLKAGSCFYGEYWIIAHQSPILSTGRPPSVRVAVVVNEHWYFVYLINTDSIKSKCLHKNSSIGRWKKKKTQQRNDQVNISLEFLLKHLGLNLYFNRCNRSRLLRQRISVFLIAHRTVKKGFSVGWLTTSGKKYLR